MYFLLIFMFHVCLCYVVLSVHCNPVITCWERTDLLALFCVVFSLCLLLKYMVFPVRCGTLYLIVLINDLCLPLFFYMCSLFVAQCFVFLVLQSSSWGALLRLSS